MNETLKTLTMAAVIIAISYAIAMDYRDRTSPLDSREQLAELIADEAIREIERATRTR